MQDEAGERAGASDAEGVLKGLRCGQGVALDQVAARS